MRQGVSRNTMAFAVADRCIVDHSIEPAERIDLSRHILRAGHGLDIAGHHRFRLWQCPSCVCRAVGIARVEDNLMTLT
jgi:hypothetical protein